MDKTVLCYIEKDNKYLMMLRNKKKNDLNSSKWIGIGGHIESGETPDLALLREVKEETGLTLKNYEYRGEILFFSDDYSEIMYLYTADKFTGQLIECDEGELHWIDIDKVLSLNLWEGDKYFLDLLTKGEKDFSLLLKYKNNELVKCERRK